MVVYNVAVGSDHVLPSGIPGDCGGSLRVSKDEGSERKRLGLPFGKEPQSIGVSLPSFLAFC
jgi:hypothetical protein